MKKCILLAYLMVFALIAHAQEFSTDKAKATVDGETSMASYTGTSNDLQGKVNTENLLVTFKIPLESIKTGVKGRDRDMYEVLEVEKFPYASFEGAITSDFDPEKKESQQVKVKGTFEIHGEKKPLEVTADLKPTDDGITFSASWPINISDFGIERPSVFFMKVDDEHIIAIEGILE